LALTAGATQIGAALANLAAQGAIVPVEPMLPEEAPLRQAQEILDRLAGNRVDEEEAFHEAEFALRQVELEVQSLEKNASSRPATSSGEAPQGAPSGEEEKPAPDPGLGPLADKLQALGVEAQKAMAGRAAMDEDAMRRLRAIAAGELDDEADVGAGGVEEEGDATTTAEPPGEKKAKVAGGFLPTLTGAEEDGDDDEDDDLLSLFSGEGGTAAAEGDSDEEAAAFVGSAAAPSSSSGAAGAAKGEEEGGPSAALLRALDIQLPASEGLWDDAELERVVRAMDEHYGDVPPDVSALPNEYPDDDADEETALG